MRDLYEVLGVERDASSSDLKKAYYRMAKKHHPDHNPDDRDAEEKFKEAAEAYQILADDDQRARYDRYGMDGVRGSASGAGSHSAEDIFSMFGDFFGGRGGGGRRQPRGADVNVDLNLTFAEAVWGVAKDVKVSRAVPCATCSGSGAKAGTKAEACRGCGGKGQVVHSQGFFMVQTTCPQCRGAGKIIKEACEDCRGRGAVAQTSTLNVTVPAGVDDGMTLRLGGKGEVATGGVPGDLNVILHVQGDERFRREGPHILTEVSISVAKAALGGEVEIYTLEEGCNGTATLEIKPGTQPGEEVVRRGQGIPQVRGNGRGDQVVRINVEVPKKLTARQEELLRELATELGDEVKEKRGLFGRSKK
jgi:molecular chaperone DnaJ